MTNSSWPCLTSLPGLKLICCRMPCTRARTSTDSTDTVRPVNSPNVVTSRSTGWVTVTSGGGGASYWLPAQPASRQASTVTTLVDRLMVVCLAPLPLGPPPAPRPCARTVFAAVARRGRRFARRRYRVDVAARRIDVGVLRFVVEHVAP